MKMSFTNLPKRRRRSGSTVLVLIMLLAIMVILATANSKALYQLRREIKWVESQQIQRLNASQTNAVSTAISQANHRNEPRH